MKTKLQLIVCMIVCSISVNSCKEKFECNTSNNVPIPQIMKDYFYYKAGTWWVYKNVKNNTYDSLWVSQSSSNNYRGEGGEGFGSTEKCYEHTVMGIDNINTKGIMRWDLANIITDQRLRFAFAIYWRDSITTQNKSLNIYYTDGQFEKQDLLYPIFISFIDTSTIQNKQYIKAIEINTNNYGYDNLRYRLFAKNIGLIKYIDRDSNQWELIKYHINQ